MNLALNIAITALNAQQKNIDVTGQNIANASTPGYSRQRAVLATGEPWPKPGMDMPGGAGQFGTGVTVKTVERLRNAYIDQQIRQQNLLQGEWQQRSDALTQMENILQEPGDTGLNSSLNNFWSAWNQLSKYPDSLPVRTTVAETAVTLADNLRQTYSQLQTLRGDLNQEIAVKVQHVNDLLTQLAGLNEQVKIARATGLTPNDLLDRRDYLLEQLSQTVNAQTTSQPDGTVTVHVGGVAVVTQAVAAGLTLLTDSNGFYQVGISSGNGPGTPLPWSDLGGELKGLATARDSDVSGLMTSLDQLAVNLAYQVNKLQMNGYGINGETGIPFFVGGREAVTSAVNPDQVSGAGSIYVNPFIYDDANRIAAAGGIIESEITTEGSLANATSQEVTLSLGDDPRVTASGVLQVTVNAAGLSGAPKTLPVAVSRADSSADIAAKIEAALSGDADISGFFNITASGNSLVLTAKSAADNDSSMAVRVEGLIYPGDAGNALKICQLKDQAVDFQNSGGGVFTSSTINDFYKSVVSRLGVSSDQAQTMARNQQSLLEQLQNSSQEACGVSLDEEMANLIEYQTAYQAAARLIGVVNDMMLTVIGLVKE